MLKVTLKRSTIKSTKSQRESIRGLGLRKIGQTRVLVDNPAIRGMITKVNHLVEVEEIAG